MTDRACIYSFPDDRHVANGSCAHIIPSAIGSRRTSTTIACGHHNNLTNTRIEKPFIVPLRLCSRSCLGAAARWHPCAAGGPQPHMRTVTLWTRQ